VSSLTNYLPSSLSQHPQEAVKGSQALKHAKTCSTVSKQLWNQLDAMVKTRWWSQFIFLDSFTFNIKTLCYMRDCPKHPDVPPKLYNLTDLLIGDLE